MTDQLPAAATREVVASFADRPHFEAAVAALLAGGFERTDLSVLASHDSLEVAGNIAGYSPDETASVEAGIAGELGFAGSIGIAGALLLAYGPVGIALAALVGAAAGAVALRPLFDRLTESAHAAGFTEAIEAGRILLWVRTADAARVEAASRILATAGGTGIARLARPVREAPAE